jgi:hypothetical protein
VRCPWLQALGAIFRFLKFFFENFISYSSDICGEKCPIVTMGGCAEGPACAVPGARTPIGASGNFIVLSYHFYNQTSV